MDIVASSCAKKCDHSASSAGSEERRGGIEIKRPWTLARSEAMETKEEEERRGEKQGEKEDDSLEPSWLTREGARRNGSTVPSSWRGRGSPRD